MKNNKNPQDIHRYSQILHLFEYPIDLDITASLSQRKRKIYFYLPIQIRTMDILFCHFREENII